MNKRLVLIAIITSVILLLLVIGAFIFRYYTSFQKVTINIEREGITAEVYKIDTAVAESHEGPLIATLTATEELSLEPGTYHIEPKGTNVDETEITFVVKDEPFTVTVNPGYSEDYLNSQLEKEFPLVKKVLEEKYKTTLKNFTIETGKLYEDGSWYATRLVKKARGSDIGDTYRTILHKEGDAWQIIAPPQLVISALEYTDIPQRILKDINKAETE